MIAHGNLTTQFTICRKSARQKIAILEICDATPILLKFSGTKYTFFEKLKIFYFKTSYKVFSPRLDALSAFDRICQLET